MGFRKDFKWGAATAAYQIEGAFQEDGKGLNIWDVFCRDKGRIYDGHTGEIACDHYHRFREDVALMKELGIKAYRFSISWSRILPTGTGQINPAGVRFYNELINELLDAGIEPFITLYHWDLPYDLYKRGGWLNPESVSWFGEYAKTAAKLFSDRVSNFFTFNEPQCFIGHGYLRGVHAPGVRGMIRDSFDMAHNVLKAHGTAVKMLREYAKGDIKIGFAPTCCMSYPDSEKAEDIEAARMHSFFYGNDNPVEMPDFKSVDSADILHKKAGTYVAVREIGLFYIFFNLMVRRKRIVFNADQGQETDKPDAPPFFQSVDKRLQVFGISQMRRTHDKYSVNIF